MVKQQILQKKVHARTARSHGMPFQGDATQVFAQATKLFVQDVNFASVKIATLEQSVSGRSSAKSKTKSEKQHLSEKIKRSQEITKLLHQLDADLFEIHKLVGKNDDNLGMQEHRTQRQITFEHCSQLLAELHRENTKRCLRETNSGTERSFFSRITGPSAAEDEVRIVSQLRPQALPVRQQVAELSATSQQSCQPSSSTSQSADVAFELEVIDKQFVQIDQGLDRLQLGVCRLKQQAFIIGAELDSQEVVLAQIDMSAKKQTRELTKLENRVARSTRRVRNSHVVLCFGCIILLLALTAWILMDQGILHK